MVVGVTLSAKPNSKWNLYKANSGPGIGRPQCNNTWPGYPREQCNTWPGYPSHREQRDTWPGYPRDQCYNTWPGYISGCVPEHVWRSLVHLDEDNFTYDTTGVNGSAMPAL